MALDQRADAVFRVIRRRISNLPASRKCPARLPRLDSTKRIVSSMDKVAFSRAANRMSTRGIGGWPFDKSVNKTQPFNFPPYQQPTKMEVKRSRQEFQN